MRNFTLYPLKKTILLGLSLLVFTNSSANAYASEDKESYPIAHLADAKIFAEFTGELPAVINYFTQHDKQEIISFYQEQYGKATSSEMKRGRLTLHFNKDNQKFRVIISKQDDRYQVDALRQE